VIDGDGVVHQAHYSHPIEAVWQVLTDPAAIAAWLMPNDFAPEVGHRFRLDARPTFGLIEGEVLEVNPPRFLRCRWTIQGKPTTLTIWLEADDDGTLLRLEHFGLSPEPRAGFDGGWGDKLHHDIALVLSGQRDIGRSWLQDGLKRHPDMEVSE
jgi:uncharacterized protein YndB with AHSA1/START domain